MKLVKPILLISILTTFVISCTKQKTFNDIPLEKLFAENVDSLANILEEINLNSLSDEDRLNYIWWLTNVHQKQNRSLINDSLIHSVLDQDKKNNAPRLYTTYQLAAEQYKYVGKLKQKEKLLKEALFRAKENGDTTVVLDFCYRLSNIYENKDILKIDTLSHTINDYRKNNLTANFYLNVVRLYNKSNQLDSILKYSQLGIDMAIKENIPSIEYDLTRSQIYALNRTGKSQKALEILKNIEKKYPLGKGIVSNEIKFDYISTFISLGQYDSAQNIIDHLTPFLDEIKYTNLATEGYIIKAVLDQFENIIKIKKAVPNTVYSSISFNYIMNGSRENLKNEREILFAQNKLQNDKLNLEIEKGNLETGLLWGAIILILIVVTIVFLYQRKLLSKERGLKKIKEQLLYKSILISNNESIITENELLIESLTSQLEENDDAKKELSELISENEKIKEQNRSLQEDILIHSEKTNELEYIEGLSHQNIKLKEREKFLSIQLIKKTKILNELTTNPRYIEEFQWVDIKQAVDLIFNSFSVCLHIDYPTLTDEDVRYCCLFRLHLSNATISSLMGISSSSVTKRKQRIKEKMGLQSSNKSLDFYLWNYERNNLSTSI